MRAVLCLCVPYAGRAIHPGDPDLVQVLAPAVGGPASPASYVLPNAPTWPALIALAQAHLAQQAPPANGPFAAGLAQTPFAAACAARLAAAGTLRTVAPGQEAAVLAPLPVGWLPGLSVAQARTLHTLRVWTLGDLAALPPALLTGVFGPRAAPWPSWARGRSDLVAPLPPPVRTPEWLAHWVVPPALGSQLLTAADLAPLVRDLRAHLAAGGRAARTLRVAIRFCDGVTAARTAPCPEPANTVVALHAVAWPLVAALLRSRRRRPSAITLAAPATVGAAHQACLLPAPGAPEPAAPLAAAINALQARFGPQIIGYGAAGLRA